MEEFRSTEILDKEIQEDARKKAEKLLKSAEIDGQKIFDETALRIEKVRAEKNELYTKRINLHKADLDAALPLEKERFLVSFESNALNNAIKEYIDRLSEEKKLLIVEHTLKRYKDAFEKTKVLVRFHGFEKSKIQKVLSTAFGEKNLLELTPLLDSQALDLNCEHGVFVDSEDKRMFCSVTLNRVFEELVDTKRFELVNALFCGRVEK